MGKKRIKQKPDFRFENKKLNRMQQFYSLKNESVISFEPYQIPKKIRPFIRKKRSNVKKGFGIVKMKKLRLAAFQPSKSIEEIESSDVIPAFKDENDIKRYFIPDECAVQFEDNVGEETMISIIRSVGSESWIEQRTKGYYTIKVLKGGLLETIRKLTERSEVKFAEPSEIVYKDALCDASSNPHFKKQWGLKNTGLGNAKEGIDIKATDAWEMEGGTTGHRNVVIVFIDTGVDLDHEDLEENLFPQGEEEDWDFFDCDNSPDDEKTHGTRVTGVASAVCNQEGIVGVAPTCRFIPLRVNLELDILQNRVDAINHVSELASKEENKDFRFIINCSWKAEKDAAGVVTAIEKAHKSNILIVFAAGNQNKEIKTEKLPYHSKKVVTVAGINSRNKKVENSNYGKFIDVCAPGKRIRTTARNGYIYEDGTSVAAPFASGVAALIWSINRDLSNDEVRKILEDSCDSVENDNRPKFRGMLGKGRLNAKKAIEMALQTLD